MPATYSHTQVSYATAGVVTGGVLVNALFLWSRSTGGLAAAIESPTVIVSALVSVPLLIGAAIFSRLRVGIRDGELHWSFGLGAFRRSIPLSRITSAVVVINPPYYGRGRRRTPRGWLYTVAGSRSVEITTDDGTRLRLGSDEPELLADAIRKARAG